MDVLDRITQEIKKRFIHNKFEWIEYDDPELDFIMYILYIDDKETYIRVDYDALKNEYERIDGVGFTKNFVYDIINPLIEDMIKYWKDQNE